MVEPIFDLPAAAGTLLTVLFGYAFGSIPFGLLFTRAAGMGDVRAIGSGNIGATNVLRTGSKPLAAATLLADALKGTVPVLLAPVLLGAVGGPVPALGAGFGAFLGHLFPVWLGFRGGKGIATYVGVTAGLTLWGLATFAIAWLLTAFATRLSSLAALVATVAVPLVAWMLGLEGVAATLGAMSVLAWIMHRANIARLRAGTEPRIGAK